MEEVADLISLRINSKANTTTPGFSSLHLSTESDALCHGVENILVSTNLQSGSSDNEQTVKPFSLTKFAGVMEQRAIEICSAFRVWQEYQNYSFNNVA